MQRRISTKLCMKIEGVRRPTIFAHHLIFSIRPVVSELGSPKFFWGDAPLRFFAYKFQIALNFNSFCRWIIRINLTDFIDIGQGVRPCKAKNLKSSVIFRFFWPETPKYLRISVKFGRMDRTTAEGTCCPLHRAKFHANRESCRPCGAKNIKIAC